MTRIDYTLSGCANGHPVRIGGTGTVGLSGAKLRFRSREAPATFDAGLAHLVGVDVVAAVVGGLVVVGDDPVIACCRTDLLGEGGVEVGTIAAVAAIERRSGRIACRVQLVEARVAAEVGEQMSSVSERLVAATPFTGGVALLSAAEVRTSRGREWIALCSVWVVGVDLGSSSSVSLVAVTR